jgi:hypothetical protein
MSKISVNCNKLPSTKSDILARFTHLSGVSDVDGVDLMVSFSLYGLVAHVLASFSTSISTSVSAREPLEASSRLATGVTANVGNEPR